MKKPRTNHLDHDSKDYLIRGTFSKLIREANRVAILVPDFSEYSGNGRVAAVQAEELVKEGKEVVIFTLRARLHPRHVKVFVLGMPRSLFWERIYTLIFPLDLIKVFKWLKKLKKFDLIISHFYPMNWLAFLAKKFYGKKYVYWYHGIVNPPSLFPRFHERIATWLDILLTKLTTRNVDHAVSVSRSAQKELKELIGLDSEVIYNKPDLRKFHRGIDGSEIRRKLNLGDAPVILNVGRICPQKGTHLLVQAFLLVKKEIPNAKLVIVGKHTFDYYSKKVKELCDDSVIFTGFVPDDELPKYYAMCDIYATCSLWEANNVPVLEAQACGKPVIAFDFEFFKEEVDEKGVLVEKGNIEKFAEACIRKLKEVRPELHL